MVIALEKDDGSLFLFTSVSEAETEFEAIDVENGEYEFCDHTGQQFVAEITQPVRAFHAGSYRLQPHDTPDRKHVSRLIAQASCLARAAAEIQSIEDLRRKYVI